MVVLSPYLRDYVMVCAFLFVGNGLVSAAVCGQARAPRWGIALFTLAQSLAISLGLQLFWASDAALLLLFFPLLSRAFDVEPYKLLSVGMVAVAYLVLCDIVFFLLLGPSVAWGWAEIGWLALGYAVTALPVWALLTRVIWPRVSRLSLPKPWWLTIVPGFVITIDMLIVSTHVQQLMAGYELVYGATAILLVLASLALGLMVLVMMEKMQAAVIYQNDLRVVDMQIATQGKRYAEMLSHVNDVRIMRHDMRHHLRYASMLLREQKYDALGEYLRACDLDDRLDEGIILSNNYVTDLILHHTLQVAREWDIDVTIQCGLPEVFWVSDMDLCVLLGNLTENALAGCRLQTVGRREMTVSAMASGEEAIIRLENTCGEAWQDTPARRKAAGLPASSGYGMSSMRSIAAKYNGKAAFERRDGLFSTSILLYRPIRAQQEKLA